MVNTNKTNVLTSLGWKRVLHEVIAKFMCLGMIGMFYVSRPYLIPLVSFYTEYHRFLHLIVYLEAQIQPGENVLTIDLQSFPYKIATS